MRILWIDDNDFTAFTRRHLEEAGHQVEVVETLLEAEMALAAQPHCILIDGCMPHPRQSGLAMSLPPGWRSNFDTGMLYAEKIATRDPSLEGKIILLADMHEATYQNELSKRLGAKGRVIPRDDLKFKQKLLTQISIIASEMTH